MKKTITESEKLQLLGLLTLGIKHEKVVNQVEDAMAALIDDETGGHLSDAVYDGNTDIDKILENMGIEIAPTTGKED